MRPGKFILFLIIPLFLLSGHNSLAISKDRSNVEQYGHGHDKKKKKKKKKKKPKKKNSTHQKTKTDTAKARKLKAKKDKKHDKNLAKVKKKRQKQADAIVKEQTKGRKDYSDCDSADVVRTSQDTLILAKYIKVYHSLGGICYIIHLQDMADLEKTSDGFYTVQMKKSSDPRAPADWQTYLFCPIGKPDGFIALVSPAGDTVQTCQYAGEKKSGLMTWFKKGEGIIHQERYVGDAAVWVSDEPQ